MTVVEMPLAAPPTIDDRRADAQLSIFASARDQTPAASCSVGDLIAAIRTGGDDHPQDLIDLIAAIRAEPDKDRRQQIKLRLPAPTPSAVFAGRRTLDSAWTHSGVVVVDVDDQDDAERMRDRAREIGSAVAAYVSPGGRGVKILMAVDPLPDTVDSHRAAVLTAMTDAHRVLGVDVDPSGLDVTRVSYVSYDPGAWFRDAPPLTWDPSAEALHEAIRAMRVCGRLTAGHVLGGALPGDIVLGSVCIPVGMTPADFDRLHDGGRHRGLVRAVQADARHGIDERDEWREAALRHMGHARSYEIDSAIEWAWVRGQAQREDVEEDSMPQVAPPIANESGATEPKTAGCGSSSSAAESVSTAARQEAIGIPHGVVREQRRGPVTDGTCAVSDGWGCSAGTRALGGRSQYASMRRRPVAA